MVTFTNTYAAAKSSGTGGGGAQLAASGFTSGDQDAALAGVLLLFIGVALLLAARPRGRPARR
jgi:predicted phage tail protein